MSYKVELTQPLSKQGWKVKIRDKERLEPPHVTIIFRKKEWRFSLRDSSFLVPPGGSMKDLPREIQQLLEGEFLEILRAEWDKLYPENPIRSEDDDEYTFYRGS